MCHTPREGLCATCRDSGWAGDREGPPRDFVRSPQECCKHVWAGRDRGVFGGPRGGTIAVAAAYPPGRMMTYARYSLVPGRMLTYAPYSPGRTVRDLS